MRRYCMILILLLGAGFILPLSAQEAEGGTPLSFSLNEKTVLNEVPFVLMPSVDIEALKKEDKYNDQIKDQPWRFGQDLFVNYNPENSGVWDELNDGSRIWRLGITSKGALSINLTFNNYVLPEGAKLYIYSTDKSRILGAFTSRNNQEDHYFATELIEDESVIIEYNEPAHAAFQGKLNLWRVTHGYRSIAEYVKSFGSSGSCNVNAVCPQGDPIRDEIKSVAMLIMGAYLCSGALINNTNNDGTPYFLSAYHCYDHGGGSYTDPGTIVFRFNWQSSTCTNPAVSPSYNSLSGSVMRAGYATSDFWLLQLNSTPPTEFNVYYLGWNRTSDASIGTKVWGIHHPSGDIKKISWCNAGVTTSAYLGATGSGTDHWRVGSWSDGTTTEGGSSGSPLLDTQGRVIGQLHGGYAACGNTDADYYGKLATSWTGGGTNATRLSNWLDPGSSGTITLEGFDPNAVEYAVDAKMLSVLEPDSTYNIATWIKPRVIISNDGTDDLTAALVTCYFDNNEPDSVEWTGSLATDETDTILFDSVLIDWGNHTFVPKIIVAGDENTANDSIIFNFVVQHCNNLDLPLAEGFNATGLPACWNLETVSGTNGTLQFLTAGTHPACSPAEGTHLVEFNSYSATAGNELRLISPGIQTTSIENIIVNFDWYHDAGFSTSGDKVTVQYSLDGSSWNNVQEILRYSASLSGWNAKSVTLPGAVENQDNIYIGFLFHSEYGNNCHLDDLHITGDITGPYADFTADVLSVVVEDTVTFTDASLNGPFSTWEWNFGSGAKPASASGQGPHKVTYSTIGTKTVSLTVDDTLTRTKVNYITVSNMSFDAPQGLYAFVFDHDVTLNWNPLFNDQFETGNLSLWDDVIEGPGTPGEQNYPYWFVTNDYVFGGNYNAQVSWGYNINTWMISPAINVKENSVLSFIWISSYYWHIDPYQNGELTLEISTDDGSTWDPLWNFTEIGVWENWAWYLTTVNLSAYAGQDVRIAFHLVANNNADVALEDVYITSGDKSLVGTYALGSYMFADKEAKSLKISKSVNAPFAKEPTLEDFTIYRNNTEIGSSETSSYSDNSLANGTYEYYVVANYTNPAGTSGPSNKIEVTIENVALDPVNKSAILNLYPNPSDGIFNIETDRNYKVIVMDITGSVIGIVNVDSSTKTIDLSNRHKGLYILKFESDENTFETKVIVK